MSASTKSSTDEALKLLQASREKIDQSLLKGHGDSISKTAYRKMLRLVDEHGPNGIKSVKMLPNWSEGETPRDLPSGYRMIFDINAAPVVKSAFPAQHMFAGTMAFRVPASQMSGSALTSTGLEVHASELVNQLNTALEVNEQLRDAYAGVFETKKRGEFDYVHEYWVVTRGVSPKDNAQLQVEIESHEGQSLRTLLSDTADLRQRTFGVQRTARAQQISNVCRAIGIKIEPNEIVNSKGLIDNVSIALNDGNDESTAVLYHDAVPVHSSTLSGMILNGSMRIGPELLRGDPNLVPRNTISDVFPSTTGTTMPTWSAGDSLEFDKISKMNVNNACVWSSGSEYHPLLARNAYRGRTQAWQRMEQGAGFTTSLALTPVAVKLAI